MEFQESERQLRQTAAAILAYAALQQFPTAKLRGGGTTPHGFGYHFQFEAPFGDEELQLLSAQMVRLINQQLALQPREMIASNAAELLWHQQQPQRAEQMAKRGQELVHVVQIGEFYDVCPDPVLEHAAAIGAFQLTHYESDPEGGVYVGGVAFSSKTELKAHLKQVILAEKRDHRRLGPALELFSLCEQAGAGRWLWHPKGMILRQRLQAWWEAERPQSQTVVTVGPYRKTLLKELGLSNLLLEECAYQAGAYFELGHALLFGQGLPSYKELPISFAECSHCLTQPDPSQSGLRGGWSQTCDKLTSFCLPEQLNSVLTSALQFMVQMANMFGFEHQMRLLGFGPGAQGNRKEWEAAEQSLTKAVGNEGLKVQSLASRERSRGPRLVIEIIDSLGRVWNDTSIQIDVELPTKLNLRYQGADGEMHQPVMVAQTVFGSLERMVALLVEHFAGDFPFWLAPEQVRILPVADKHCGRAEQLKCQLRQKGICANIDSRKETLAGRVRLAQLQKIPYTVVLGDKEQEQDRVAVRSGTSDEVRSLATDDWIRELEQERETKALSGSTPQR